MVSEHVLVYFVDDFSKVGWSIKLAVLNSLLIAIDHLRDAIDARIEDVAVQSEAVRPALGVRGDGAAETVKVQLLVTVVELKDVAHALDRLNVLVAVWIHKM